MSNLAISGALPARSHPTLTVLVDDSKSFTQSLMFQMSPDETVVCFNDPGEARDWLRRQFSVKLAPFFPARLLGLSGKEAFSQGAAWLGSELSTPGRFLHPAVVVVDYSMPQQNGLEFCASIKDLPCKKILLTGTADASIGIEGFNKRIIDRYMKKNDAQVLERLAEEIEALRAEYFADFPSPAREAGSLPAFEFLKDPAIAELAKFLSKRHGFAEHWLSVSPPGLLMADGAGKAKLLVIETAEQLAAREAQARAAGAPEDLAGALGRRQASAFFWPSSGEYGPGCEEWKKLCLPAQVCHGSREWHWALHDWPEALSKDGVASRSGFLDDFETDPDAAVGR